MTFYLGTHLPHWLQRQDTPLFVSRRRLVKQKHHRPSMGPWCLDSGGFSEISAHGTWRTPMEQYVDEVRQWSAEIGNLCWAAIQDWMCEPAMLEATGLSVSEHQLRTTESYLALMDRAPEVPWCPVLQGWEPVDYQRHVGMYRAAGVDLCTLPVVGVGTVCRRQHTEALQRVIWPLYDLGLKLHGFGVKRQGLEAIHAALVSADSLAWSFAARKRPPLPGCTHRTCANCWRWASQWREETLEAMSSATIARQRELAWN